MKNPKVQGTSPKRSDLVRRRNSHPQIVSRQSAPNRSDGWPFRRAGNVTAKHTEHTKKSGLISEMKCRNSTEGNEGNKDGSPPSFSSLASVQNARAQSALRSRRTSKLTDRRALTHEESKTPRRRSEAQTAVRCSALVRHPNVHHSRISGPSFSGKTQ